MTPDQHRKKAEELRRTAKRLIAASYDRNAAGSSIRERWRQQGRDMYSEAAVHAALGSESGDHPSVVEGTRTVNAILAALSKEHRIEQIPPWPPHPESEFNLTRFRCVAGDWDSGPIRDVRGNELLDIARADGGRHVRDVAPGGAS